MMVRLFGGLILGHEFVINHSCLLMNPAAAADGDDGSFLHHPSSATQCCVYKLTAVRCHVKQQMSDKTCCKLFTVHCMTDNRTMVVLLHFVLQKTC